MTVSELQETLTTLQTVSAQWEGLIEALETDKAAA